MSVIEAEDGQTALIDALTDVPSLIVTELTLPVISGTALCEILRRNERTSHVPIIAVTAEIRNSEINHALAVGVNKVLRKPASVGALLQTAHRLIEESRALRQDVRQTIAKSSADRER